MDRQFCKLASEVPRFGKTLKPFTLCKGKVKMKTKRKLRK